MKRRRPTKKKTTESRESGATYVYCVVQKERAPRLGKPPAGLEGAGEPRVLSAGDGLWLVVADAPLERYGAEAIDRGLENLDWVSRCALAHEAVVEHLLARGTVVPMKLFTLFSNDTRAVDYVNGLRSAIERICGHIAGCEEWGVRVLLPRSRIRRPTTEIRTDSGTAFLQSKRRLRDDSRLAVETALKQTEALFAALMKRASDSRKNAPPPGVSSPPLLDAAFLVQSRRAGAFRSAVAEAAPTIAEAGCDIELSGPWPAYNFVQVAR